MKTKRAKSNKKAVAPKTELQKFEVRHFHFITDLFEQATKETANRFLTLEQITEEVGRLAGFVFDKTSVKGGLLFQGFRPIEVGGVMGYAVFDKYFEPQKHATLLNFTPAEKEAVTDFFSFYTFEEVQQDLLAIQIRSLASTDSDALTPLQRANDLALYKHLVSVLKPLFNQKEAILALN